MKRKLVASVVLVLVMVVVAAVVGPSRLLAQRSPMPVQTSNADADGWHVVASPTESKLKGVAVSSPSSVWAVGGVFYYEQDPIILSSSSGTWVIEDTFASSNQHYQSVSFGSADEGWAVGYQLVAHYIDGSWTRQDASYRSFIHRVRMVAENDGWMVGYRYGSGWPLTAYGLIRHYNGASWEEQCNALDRTFTDVSMVDADEGWIVGAANLITPWTTVAHSTVGSLDVLDETDVTGIILHRSSAASGWVDQATAPNTLYSVDAVSADDTWAAGAGGLIMHYTSSGGWETVTSPVTTTLRRLAMLSADEGWIVGDGGVLLQYQGGGWTKVTSPTSEDLLDLVVVDPDEAWAVGANGTILHYLEPPTASFVAIPTSGLKPLNVTFTDTSTGTIEDREWTFGDGASASGLLAIDHTYVKGGEYPARLTVSNPGGSSSATQQILVGDWGTELLSAGVQYSKTLTEMGTYIVAEPMAGHRGQVQVVDGATTVGLLAGSQYTVTVTQDGFSPARLTVPVATTVTWIVDSDDTETYTILVYGPRFYVYLPLVVR
jgi:photosystem II stability/assembly factor-like uncharacterized protein